jgi:hypothetical protein
MDIKKIAMYGAATLLIIIAVGYIVNKRSAVITAGA